MNEKLEEKRRKLDEARKAAERADNSDLGTPGNDDLPPDAIVTKHGDVVLHGEEVDPNETNAMGERAINNPEGNVSDVNRDTDTDGDADGNPLTWGHQGIDKGIEPQTTDPRVNPQGENPLYGQGDMKTYDPATLPAGSPIPGVVAPTQGDGQYEGNVSIPGTRTAPHGDQVGAGDLSNVSPRISARTQAELDRGKQIIGQKEDERATAQQRRTVVTDADDDADGEKGRKAAEKKAASKADTKSSKTENKSKK
jgi:hypothetical protein